MKTPRGRQTPFPFGAWAGAVAALLLASPVAAQQGVPNAFEADVEMEGPSVEGGSRIHVIQRGDTLWYLSELYLHDAMRWPQLWALNPHVTNPHWIFPGDRLYLDSNMAAAHAESPGGRTIETLHNRTPRARPPRLARTVGFLAAREYRPAGTLEYAREEKLNLSTYDEVYLRFDEELDVQPGQRFTIYREDREVKHPQSGEVAGRLVKYLGTVRVLDTSTRLKKAVIEDAVEEIRRGDRLTTHFQQLHRVAPRANEIEVDATVMATYRELDLYAQDQYVFVDKGAQDGVHIGNRFQLRERGDRYLQGAGKDDSDPEDFPWEISGEALVVEVYEDHCLAVITHAIHEFESGQYAHMPEGY